MTSRERLGNAWRSQEVDHAPLALRFWPTPKHPCAAWNCERERLDFYRRMGWDTSIEIEIYVKPDPEVQVEVKYEAVAGQPVVHQVWHTPGGRIEERMRVTDDWPGDGRNSENPIPFLDDFRTSRYIEFPFKTIEDLRVLPYLFQIDDTAAEEQMAERHRQAQILAAEFNFPIMAKLPAGMDWLIWLFPPEDIIIRTQTEPEFVHALLDHINAAYEKQLNVLLELGVDALCRRGWYESTDFWSPELFAQFAKGPLETEIRACHAAKCPFIYQMDSGIVPLLDELRKLDFDCLLGADPGHSPADLATIRKGLPGKSLWGGISGPLHLGSGTPEQTERAVEQAFSVCGQRGFILGIGVGIRHNWDWKNIEACERAWRRLRSSVI